MAKPKIKFRICAWAHLNKGVLHIQMRPTEGSHLILRAHGIISWTDWARDIGLTKVESKGHGFVFLDSARLNGRPV